MTNTFDFSTIYTAILTSNILIAIIAVIIRNEKIMINAGYRLITIFLILTAVRFLLPFEVPFATSIALPEGISHFFVQLFTPFCIVAGIDITPLRIIAFVWIIGIFVQTFLYCKVNRQLRKRILAVGKDVTNNPSYSDILKEITNKSISHLRIFEIPELTTPLIYGFFKPYILLPTGFNCTEKELTYILRHEISHYLHHDLHIKFLMKLLTIIYWWNPFGYMLYNQMNLVLEMRIDDAVVNRNDKETLEYLKCLLHLAEYQDNVYENSMSNTISFTRSDEKLLTKRFQMLIQRKQKKNLVLNLILVCLIGCIYMSSYLFALEGYVNASDVDQVMFDANEINSYIIDNGDGTYDFYLSGYRIETIKSLDNYSDDIPVFTREEYGRVQQEDPE